MFKVSSYPLQDIVLLQSCIVGEYHPFIAMPPPASPTLLQYYCTPIARYTTPHRPPLLMPYTIQYLWWQYRVKAKFRPTTSSSCWSHVPSSYICIVFINMFSSYFVQPRGTRVYLTQSPTVCLVSFSLFSSHTIPSVFLCSGFFSRRAAAANIVLSRQNS